MYCLTVSVIYTLAPIVTLHDSDPTFPPTQVLYLRMRDLK